MVVKKVNPRVIPNVDQVIHISHYRAIYDIMQNITNTSLIKRYLKNEMVDD